MLRVAWTGDPLIFLVRHPARDLELPSFSPPPDTSLTPCTPEQLAEYLGEVSADLHFVQTGDTKKLTDYNDGIRYAIDLAFGAEYVDGYYHTDLAIMADGQYLQLVLLPQYGPEVMRPGRTRG